MAFTQFEIAGGIKNMKSGPLDGWRGPYATVEDACAAIPNIEVDDINFREGKIVDIGEEGDYRPYWWQGGYADENLVAQLLQGYSAYEIAVQQGFVGTEEEWIQSIKQPALDAATTANTAASAANTAASNANTATSNANEAASDATEATGLANTATTNANTATGNANTAADNANAATTAIGAAKGWVTITAIEADGADREVEKIVDYVEGTGVKPTANIGKYIGDTGLVATKAEAKNVKGSQGIPGISTTNMATNRILGRTTAGTGTPEALEAVGLTLSAGKAYNAVVGGIGSSQVIRISNPIGGSFRPGTGTLTGALKIKIPVVATNVFYIIKGTIHHSVIAHSTFVIYWYNSTPNSAYASASFNGTKSHNVRWYIDGATEQYLAIGELTDAWGSAGFTIDDVISMSSPSVIDRDATGWEMSLITAFTGTLQVTRLANINLPFSNQNQVISDFAVGANTPVLNTDSKSQRDGKFQGQINARLTQAQGDGLYLNKYLGGATSTGFGCYIETAVLATITRRFFFRISTRGNATQNLTQFIGQFTITATGTISIQNVIELSETSTSVSIFRNASGFICLWFSLTSNSNTIVAEMYQDLSSVTVARNEVTSITNVAKPAGITDEVVVVSKRAILNNGSASNLVLGDGTYKAVNDAVILGYSPSAYVPTSDASNMNSLTTNNIVYATSANANSPFSSGIVVSFGRTSLFSYQIGIGNNGAMLFREQNNGVWGVWKTLLTSLDKGAANGVVPLGADTKISSIYLPSYVDDVLEFANLAAFPVTGETGKIYVALDTNLTYRWSGTVYARLDDGVVLGETSGTAYRGDRGKAAYDHSLLTTGNPHNVTKAQVGLGNVDNTADSAKPVSTAQQAALDLKATVIKGSTSVSGAEWNSGTKDVTLTGAATTDMLVINNNIMKDSNYIYLVSGVVTATNTVRLYFTTVGVDAGSSDASLFIAGGVPVGSFPITVNFAVIK